MTDGSAKSGIESCFDAPGAAGVSESCFGVSLPACAPSIGDLPSWALIFRETGTLAFQGSANTRETRLHGEAALSLLS